MEWPISSDNFQKKITWTDPKGQQENPRKRSPILDHFYLLPAYSASLSQYTQKTRFIEIATLKIGKIKINAELSRTIAILQNKKLKR